MKKIIPKILAVVGIVCVLVACFAVPSFAYNYVGAGSQAYSTTFLNGYTVHNVNPSLGATYDIFPNAHVALNSSNGHNEGWRYTDFHMDPGWDSASEYYGRYRQRYRSNGLIDTIVEYSMFDLWDATYSANFYYIDYYELHFNPLNFSGDSGSYQFYPEHFELSHRMKFSDATASVSATLEIPYMFSYFSGDECFVSTDSFKLDIFVNEIVAANGGQVFPFDDPNDIILKYREPASNVLVSYSWLDYFDTYDTVDSFTRYVIDRYFSSLDEYFDVQSNMNSYDIITPFDLDTWSFNFSIDSCRFDLSTPRVTDDLGNYLNNSCSFSCSTSAEDNEVDYTYNDFYHHFPYVIVQEIVDVNPFDWIVQAIGGFLDIQVFGGDYPVTFGTILLVVMVIPLFIALLKLFAGG